MADLRDTSDPFLANPDAGREIWRRLSRPLDAPIAIEAVFGAPHAAMVQLGKLLVAAGPEANALLAAAPGLLRVLPNTTTKSPERVRGEVRGPIIWSETLSARAGSFGADDLFVCATPARNFDIPENRVLARALRSIERSGSEVARMPERFRSSQLAHRAVANGDEARRILSHRALAQAFSTPYHARDLARTRGGRNARTFGPAMRQLERLAEPVTVEDVFPHTDRRTRIQHGLVVALVAQLEALGVVIDEFDVVDGALVAGPITYRHPRQVRFDEDAHGIVVGGVLCDVPDRVRERDQLVAQASLERRAGGLPCYSVLEVADIDIVVDAALSLGTISVG